ncbi:MAG: septum site-determining protein MinC [Pseudomonadota bacterium]|jgi:septum site-determining protein MinC
MAAASSASSATSSAVFELKSAALTLLAVQLRTADLALLAAELDARFGATPGLFEQEPVAIDLSPLREADEAIDMPALLALLKQHEMRPLAVKGGSAAQMAAALAAGLFEAPETAQAPAAPTRAAAEAAAAVAAAPVEPAAAAPVTAPAPAVTTMVIDKPLRSGQQVYAKGCDLVVLAVVNFGAEVIADGSIHVYAPLRGRAIAGARGNTEARIFSTCMEPQLISIAGIYRTAENSLAAPVQGQPAQVRLDGEKLVFEPLTF